MRNMLFHTHCDDNEKHTNTKRRTAFLLNWLLPRAHEGGAQTNDAVERSMQTA